MAIKTSGQIGLQEIANEYRDSAPHVVSELAGLTNGLTSGAATKFSDFYGKESAFSPRIYNGDQVVGVYLDSVDRDVYWMVDIRTMGNRFWSNNSDFNFNSYSFSNSSLPGISQPELYSSVSINTTGSSSGRDASFWPSTITVHQQPTALNNWIGIIRANDNAFGGRVGYNLKLNITATGASGVYTAPNLWFDKTAVRADPGGSPGPNSTTVMALFPPRCTPISYSWTVGSSAYTLTNTNARTVTVTNNSNYYAGSYEFNTGGFNWGGSSLTCTAVLRYNGINYTVSRRIFVSSYLSYEPAPPADGGGL